MASKAPGWEGLCSSASRAVVAASVRLYFSRNSSTSPTRASMLSGSLAMASSKALSASLKSCGSSAPRAQHARATAASGSEESGPEWL